MKKLFQTLQLINTPPRTQAAKQLRITSNVSEGNLAISLYGGWSEYKPADVEKIINSLQSWLDALVAWECSKCLTQNHTTARTDGTFGYKWVRCFACKKKTPYTDIFGE